MRPSFAQALLFAGALVAAESAEATEGNPTSETQRLPRYEVRERRGVTNFGMTVVTNLGVIWGGKIKWMRVGQVTPGSAAALGGLGPDDDILSIDDLPVAHYKRRAMLEKFFDRAPGTTLRLLIRNGRTRHLRQLDLKADAPPPGL